MHPPCSYIDTHSHINTAEFDGDRSAVRSRMREAGVCANVVGVDQNSSIRACELAAAHNNLWAVVGSHPIDDADTPFSADAYAELCARPKVVAVGECGLDYHHLGTAEGEAVTAQKERFARQIELAVAHNLPLMIHCRPQRGTMDAYIDALALLRTQKQAGGQRLRGVFHFFVGTADIVRGAAELGFGVSFSGVVTFTREYHEAVRAAQADMLHAETDAPFAAPVPHRGTRNEPAFVRHTVETLAEIRGEPLEPFRTQLLKNAQTLFGIEVPA